MILTLRPLRHPLARHFLDAASFWAALASAIDLKVQCAGTATSLPYFGMVTVVPLWSLTLSTDVMAIFHGGWNHTVLRVAV